MITNSDIQPERRGPGALFLYVHESVISPMDLGLPLATMVNRVHRVVGAEGQYMTVSQRRHAAPEAWAKAPVPGRGGRTSQLLRTNHRHTRPEACTVVR